MQETHEGSGLATAVTEVRERAGELLDQAREQQSSAADRMRGVVDRRSSEIGEQSLAVGSALRRAGEQLEGQQQDAPARVLRALAVRTEDVGRYLRNSTSAQLLDDAEGAARQRPWAAATGGLLLGFAAARFLKASSGRRYDRAFADRAYADRMVGQGGQSTGWDRP